MIEFHRRLLNENIENDVKNLLKEIINKASLSNGGRNIAGPEQVKSLSLILKNKFSVIKVKGWLSPKLQ